MGGERREVDPPGQEIVSRGCWCETLPVLCLPITLSIYVPSSTTAALRHLVVQLDDSSA